MQTAIVRLIAPRRVSYYCKEAICSSQTLPLPCAQSRNGSPHGQRALLRIRTVGGLFFKPALFLAALSLLPIKKLAMSRVNALRETPPQFLAIPVAKHLYYYTCSRLRCGSPPGGGAMRFSVKLVGEHSKLKLFGGCLGGGQPLCMPPAAVKKNRVK